MDGYELDSLIDELENMVTSSFSPLVGRWIKYPQLDLIGSFIYDWRPAWQKAREIQELFKSVCYPTKSDREHAWIRFNNIRNDLSERSNANGATLLAVSQSWRDVIADELRSLQYVYLPILDEINPTTVDEMKVLGQRLRRVRTVLHENRHQMLKEHKDECYALVEEIKQSHDRFWEQTHKAREEHRQSHLRSMREVAQEIPGNLERNLEKLERATNALERAEENVAKNEAMLASAHSDSYREKVKGWLAESIEKCDSIIESISRFNEWIAQDRERLNDLLSKIAQRE